MNTAASPRFAIVMYTTNPTAVPASDVMPARHPWLTLRETR
jgi:hypothetical protein